MKKIILLFVLLPAVLVANRGQAAFYTVTGTADNTDSVTHGGSGTVGAPFQMSSLRGAIIAANANAGADTITLPAGTYTLTIANTGGVNEDACLQGDLDVTDSLTINGAGAASTLVQAGTTAANGIDKVFAINPLCDHAVAFVMSGVTIRFGLNTQPNGAADFSFTGGGIDFCGNGASSCTLKDCVVTNNSNVNGYGGGMNIDEVAPANSVVTITNTTFANNTSGLWGGGLNIFGDDVQVTIPASTFSGNQTIGAAGAGAQGGGINIRITGQTAGTTPFVTINNNSIISNNVAKAFGGGVCVAGSGNQNVTIQNSSIIGNTVLNNAAISSEGGGLYHDNDPSKTTTLNNVLIANNHSDTSGGAGTEAPEGGGILIGSGVVTLTGNCIITNNTSVNGGGIFNRNANALFSMTGGLVANNQARTNGGGIFVNAGTMTLTNLTVIANNATNSGGGLFVGAGSLNMVYSRIVNNTAASGIGLGQIGGTANVINNWWGTNNPAGRMSGTVTFTPWLMLNHFANPGTIFVPNSTTLTATFLTNSAGTAIALANLNTLIGLPITFNNAVRGILSGAQTTIQSSGTATATFTANAAGAGSADAVVDNQATTASITIPTGVSSINRVQTTPTNLNSVSWTVTFTNAVSGVASGNFSLVNGGLGGAPAISSVTAVGGAPATSWTVTASTGSGTGTLGLNMANGAGVSATILNLPFTGQVYTIDLVAPALTCSTDIVVTASGSCPAVVNYTVSVSDNLALSSATTNPASGSVFPVGTDTVTLTARDTAGNTNFCTFKVTVLPGAAPQLSIVRSGTNIVVSWTNAYDCYALQSASALASNTWSLYPGPFATNSGKIYVTNSTPFTNRFFRLSF